MMKKKLMQSYSIVLIVLLCTIGVAGLVLARTGMIKVQYKVTEAGLEKSMGLGQTLFEKIYGEIEYTSDKQLLSTNVGEIGKGESWVDVIKENTGHQATIFVKNDKGFERIASTIFDESGKSIVGTVLDANSKAYPAMNEGKSYIGEANILGDNYITIYEPLKNDKGEVMGYLFMGDTTKNIDRLIKTLQDYTMWVLVSLGVAGVIIGLAWTYWVANKIAKPLEITAAYMDKLSQLDLTQEVPEIIITQKDEIGVLGKALKNLTQALRQTIGSADELAMNVNEEAFSLSHAMNAMNQGSQEIALVVDQIADGATHQAGNTQDGAMRIEELGEIVGASQKHIETLEKMTNQVNDLKNEGMALIEVLSVQSDTNQKAVKETYSNIQESKMKTDVIVNAVEKIKAISSQTNLLALNASIEAARSGEDGKGFVVIASEIRKLAELSDRFTKEIEINIAALGSSSMIAVENMGSITNEIEKQTENVKETENKFKGIAIAVDDTLKRLSEVVAKQRLMTTKNNEMIEIMQSLSAIAEENAAATQEVASSIKEQSQFTENIFETSDTLSKLAQDMRGQVAQFKL